jgi:hypothetical protein
MVRRVADRPVRLLGTHRCAGGKCGPAPAPRRPTKITRLASTVPVWAFGTAVTTPAKAARAAASASIGSDFPRARRVARFGRFTSTSSIPRKVKAAASPAP